MQIALTPDQELQLDDIACSHGVSRDQLAQEVLQDYLANITAADQELLDSIAQADRGEMIDHSEIVAWTREKLGSL